jgi:hypothetical protein
LLGEKRFLAFLEKIKRMIKAVVFSYQNKNLKNVVDQLIQNTKSEIFILIFDKHTIDRSSVFNESSYKDYVEYKHIYWDELIGFPEYKGNFLDADEAEYFLCCSDDTLVSKNWDERLINFLKEESCVISGQGSLALGKKDWFFFDQVRGSSSEFTLSNFIDRNFIFGKANDLKNVYPKEVKYYGEEEMLSLNLFNKKIKIFSCPSDFYKDLGARTIENSYVPFSLEHGYNEVMDSYLDADSEFLEFHNINAENINRLPYNPDDVLYHPYQLKFQEVDARKFLLSVKEIS